METFHEHKKRVAKQTALRDVKPIIIIDLIFGHFIEKTRVHGAFVENRLKMVVKRAGNSWIRLSRV